MRATDLNSIKAGQHEIKQDDVRPELPCHVDGAQPVRGFGYLESLLLQVADDYPADRGLVLHDENANLRCSCTHDRSHFQDELGAGWAALHW